MKRTSRKQTYGGKETGEWIDNTATKCREYWLNGKLLILFSNELDADDLSAIGYPHCLVSPEFGSYPDRKVLKKVLR